MDYKELLNSHLKYGASKDDIIARNNYKDILENVVLAPWWDHTIFDNFGFKIEQVSDKIFNLYKDNISFSFIELKQIGAPSILESVLPLGVTKCKNLVFIGSAGSLDENIKIGDLVIPEFSICGDGASRYLNKNMEDEFLKKEYPSKDITNKLIDILNKDKIRYFNVPNFSVDTIFAQYMHLDKIIEFGAKTIEMETASLYKCNELLNINMTSILCISDNTILNKSLFNGRTPEEKEYRYKVRNEVIPKLIIDLFKNINI